MALETTNLEMNGKWQDLVDYCLNLYEEIRTSSYRDKTIAEIKKSIKTYEQDLKKASYPWENASNIILPLTTITVDNLEPRIVASLTGRPPLVQFKTENEPDQTTEILEAWFNEELKNKVHIKPCISKIVHKLLLEGTAYPLVKYDQKEVLRRDFVFDEEGNILVDEAGEPDFEDVVDELFQGGKVELVEFTDIFVSDDIIDWEDADIIRVVRLTYGELMNLKDALGYENIGEWLLRDEIKNKTGANDRSPLQDFEDISITGKEVIECLECHVRYVYKDVDTEKKDIKNWQEERMIVLIAKEKGIILRRLLLREINFKNEHVIKQVRLYPEQGKAYGKSVYGKLKSIQIGASDIFNLIINTATICMIPWFIYSDKTGFEKKEPVIEPGKGIKVDNPNEVKFPNFNVQAGAFIEFIMLYMSLWERLSSIGDLQIGRNKETKTTATETLAVIQEGNIKHNYQAELLKESFVSIFRTVYDLYYKNMPFKTMFLWKEQPIEISRQAMRRPYKFVLSGSSDMANKVLEMGQSEKMYDKLRNDPVVNPMELLKDFINSYKPDVNTERYINPQINQLINIVQQRPEIMQVIGQHLQQEQQGPGQPQQPQQQP